ncbi:hypothetical protein QQS21_005989 [Conoideocrella luteorostrata]|uniref:Bacteriophage T5 Orf172 DNA-binding domain-containing protein n=1 Tax=Conoideocrella luteorostrata TaxID=1105319 RepID=A0AAJ0CNH0_9HYPO|nr:hypothetical protein QQS21_005989 [Conoideocrella luteorostrata]
MPFVANTPESLLDRADSKNPSSTCRGITSNGRPCRRPLGGAAQATLAPRGRGAKIDLGDETLYCWQHKEQASHSAKSSPGPRKSAAPPILEERSSLDTLADRLGVLDLQGRKSGKQQHGRPQPHAPPKHKTRPKTSPKLTFCFCFSVPLEEVNEPAARPKPRPKPDPIQKPASASMPNLHSRLPPHSGGISGHHQRITSPNVSPGKASYRSAKSNLSQTAQFKHLIPDTLDTVTASALMAELAKPYADSEEAGYIYMFWLTPTDKPSPPPVDAARSLLAPPSMSASPARSRRPSDVVSTFADTGGKAGKKTMLLKIGRAANVQRRMNQWQRQCGYDIEMLRYYPYVAAGGGGGGDDRPGTSRTPRTTPHCRRVERLIHIELAGMGFRADLPTCETCGKEHREWFEVKATREGIRKVDDVIRRWVDWDEVSVD